MTNQNAEEEYTMAKTVEQIEIAISKLREQTEAEITKLKEEKAAVIEAEKDEIRAKISELLGTRHTLRTLYPRDFSDNAPSARGKKSDKPETAKPKPIGIEKFRVGWTYTDPKDPSISFIGATGRLPKHNQWIVDQWIKEQVTPIETPPEGYVAPEE